MVNRTQGLVLGFFVLAWASLVAILAAAPEVYEQSLGLPRGGDRPVAAVFLAALSAFLVLLGTGVVGRWRWTFWLVVVAFVLGVLRVPVAVLQLMGVLPTSAPSWYALVQGFL